MTSSPRKKTKLLKQWTTSAPFSETGQCQREGDMDALVTYKQFNITVFNANVVGSVNRRYPNRTFIDSNSKISSLETTLLPCIKEKEN